MHVSLCESWEAPTLTLYMSSASHLVRISDPSGGLYAAKVVAYDYQIRVRGIGCSDVASAAFVVLINNFD